MAVGIVDRQKLVNIADAVREKKGITEKMTLDAIASNITSMPTASNNANFDFSRSIPLLPGNNSKLLPHLNKIDLSGWDTSDITDMSKMFNSCYFLKSLDVSGFNTSKVTNMSNMFNSCWEIKSLDVSGFNTSKVTNMSYMFNGCSSLTSLDLSNWNTSKVTNMSYMFNGCSSLTSLDLSNWNTASVTNMSRMFNGCNKLSNLTLGNDWASNSSISSFDLSYCPLTRESAVDVINKLATRDNSPVITFSNEVGLYQSEIDVATNKGWSVSGCTVLGEVPPGEDPSTATVGQSALIDGVMSKCVYVADTPQDWGQRIFASQSYFTDSNGNSEYQWGGYETATGITATAIGTGLTNTNALLAMNLQSTDGTPTVWDALKEFRAANGDRWFIPSSDEGVESYKQGMSQMWTSSEYDSSNAYATYEHNHNFSSKAKVKIAYAFTYV